MTVTAFWAVGRGFRLSLPAYQLLGVFILLLFQIGIHRQPLRCLWVRSATPLQLDGKFTTLWALFSLCPAYEGVLQLRHLHPMGAVFCGVAIVGAFGLAHAIKAMSANTWRQLGLCVLTISAIGILPQLLLLLFTHATHLHFVVGRPRSPVTAPSLSQSLAAATQTFFIGLPLGFIVEEAFFRGALDTYVHTGEEGVGWGSAVFVSALWGLWHLTPGPRIVGRIIGLLVAQIAVGVPLSLWWRKSGNLAVDNTAHALLDAFRNGLAGTGIF